MHKRVKQERSAGRRNRRAGFYPGFVDRAYAPHRRLTISATWSGRRNVAAFRRPFGYQVATAFAAHPADRSA